MRVTSGYRTVSTNVKEVIGSILPLELFTEERDRLYRREDSHLEIVQREEREYTLAKWQKM